MNATANTTTFLRAEHRKRMEKLRHLAFVSLTIFGATAIVFFMGALIGYMNGIDEGRALEKRVQANTPTQGYSIREVCRKCSNDLGELIKRKGKAT